MLKSSGQQKNSRRLIWAGLLMFAAGLAFMYQCSVNPSTALGSIPMGSAAFLMLIVGLLSCRMSVNADEALYELRRWGKSLDDVPNGYKEVLELHKIVPNWKGGVVMARGRSLVYADLVLAREIVAAHLATKSGRLVHEHEKYQEAYEVRKQVEALVQPA